MNPCDREERVVQVSYRTPAMKTLAMVLDNDIGLPQRT